MEGIWDIHCHIVPQVDDGSASLEMSMAMLKNAYKNGVRGMIMTPHFRKGMFETDRDTVERQFLKLREAAGEAWPDLVLRLGCEFHANLDMPEMVTEDARYRMNGGRCVLVEFSGGDPVRMISGLCRELRSGGYLPIVAHAERCGVIVKNPEVIDELHEFGAYVQINADSIIGKDGWGMKRFCAKLLRTDRIDFVGSDAHNLQSRPSRIGECAEFLRKNYGESYARDLLIRNPICVARGEEL